MAKQCSKRVFTLYLALYTLFRHETSVRLVVSLLHTYAHSAGYNEKTLVAGTFHGNE